VRGVSSELVAGITMAHDDLLRPGFLPWAGPTILLTMMCSGASRP